MVGLQEVTQCRRNTLQERYRCIYSLIASARLRR
jgi:hypothetical protein